MRLISGVIRLAVVTSVNFKNNIAKTQWIDQNGEAGPDIYIPHPATNPSGEGFYLGLKRGAIVLMGMLSGERYYPVAILPPSILSNDLQYSDDIYFDNVGLPRLEPGDVLIQGQTSSLLKFKNNGTVSLQNSYKEGFEISDNEESFRCSIDTAPPVQYTIYPGGIKSKGVVRRYSGKDLTIVKDYLTDLNAEQSLEEIGWDKNKKIAYISDNQSIKNPAFIEDREIIFEFGKDWNIGTIEQETKFIDGKNNDEIQFNTKLRRNRRNNVLSLSQTNPNELIEIIKGTLVDFFGNPLSINRSILPVADIKEKDLKKILEQIYEINKHSVAFHMEINTKKGYYYQDNELKPVYNVKDFIDDTSNNSRIKSKWNIEVDKEGLTTINIPATSETGNIPLLTRQENSTTLFENSNEIHNDALKQDIYHEQFGPGGISIIGDGYSKNKIKNRLEGKSTSWEDYENNRKVFKTYIESGTAFHNIVQTAQKLLKNDSNIKSIDYLNNEKIEDGYSALVDFLISEILNNNEQIVPNAGGAPLNKPNAGGRSLALNLDGSMEVSIGANTSDRASLILDTAGSIVQRIGRDRYGRSAIIQTDGTISLEVGGYDFIGESNDSVDQRFVGKDREKTLPSDPKRYRSGKIIIRVRRANSEQNGPDGSDNLLIIDDTGITIESAGRLNLISKMDMVLKSDSSITLEAPVGQIYSDNPKYLIRDGRNM